MVPRCASGGSIMTSGRSKLESSSIPGRLDRTWGFQNRGQPRADNSFKDVAQLQYIMASSKFGRKLNPHRSLREPLCVKGVRQSVVITNNPSSIDQNQQLLVRFPNLGKGDVIVPGTVRLAFTITLNSEEGKWSLPGDRCL